MAAFIPRATEPKYILKMEFINLEKLSLYQLHFSQMESPSKAWISIPIKVNNL